MKVKSVDGIEKDVACIGCALQKGDIERFGGLVFETDNFCVQQDYEIPIPGFMILASKKHLKGIEDFDENMRKEYVDLLYKIRIALKKVLNIEFVYFIQEEDSIIKKSHFHTWIFPRYAWMNRFGEGVKSIRPIMKYARDYLKNKNNLDQVKKAVQDIKNYLS